MTALPGTRWLVGAALVGLLAAGGAAAGCAKPKAVANLPPEGAAPPQRAPVPQPAPVSPRPAAPAAPAPAAPPPALVVPPAPAPAPPAAVPPTAVPPKPTPPPVLSPEIGTEEERRLTTQAQSRIEGAERLVAQIDQKRLGRPQQETFSTIQSFIVKAREAMTARDYQRAFTLADKAKVLAEELSQRPR